MMGQPVTGFLHEDSLRGILIAIYDLAAQAAGVSVAPMSSCLNR